MSMGRTASQVAADKERLSSELQQAQTSLAQMEKARAASATEYESTFRELKDVQNQLRQLMEELNAANQKVENSVDTAEMEKVKTERTPEPKPSHTHSHNPVSPTSLEFVPSLRQRFALVAEFKLLLFEPESRFWNEISSKCP